MKRLMIGATAFFAAGALLVAGANATLASERITRDNAIGTLVDVVSGRVPDVCVAKARRLALIGDLTRSAEERISFRRATEKNCTADIAIRYGALRPA